MPYWKQGRSGNFRSKSIPYLILILCTGVLFSGHKKPGDDCPEQSRFSLPYRGNTDIHRVTYSFLQCDIEGVAAFLCGHEKLRYIALPDYKNVSVVLVPQDCGDFEYRFYLLTITGNKVVSSLYVEGEWYEPGDDSYKEITGFSIDKDYTITIQTESIENGVSSGKKTVVYRVSDQGVLEATK